MAKHPHYEVMMEWATDTSKVVQFRHVNHQPWEDTTNNTPLWNPATQYRIKPEKKPDIVAVGIVEVDQNQPINIASYRTSFRVSEHFEKDNIRLTFDGETGKLIKAEVLHAE